MFIDLKNKNLEDKMGIVLFLFSFIFLGLILSECFKSSIWNDEAFSLLLIQESYYKIIITTMFDVHPPLYYFILKFVVSLFQVFGLSVDSTIVVAKFVSVVPFVLLLVLSFFKVREYWGWLCCGVFAVCLTSMLQLMHFAVEIRMYSWALFFVTVCFIYAYGVIVESSRKNWVILVLSGVCAAYTHYFAAVPVIMVFLLLLMYFVFNERSMVKKWFFAVISSSALYMFWLFALITQIRSVTQKFWIKPISLNVLINYLGFIFSPSNIFYPYLDLMAILFVISYFIVFVYFVRCKFENHEYFILGGTFVLILTVLFGIIISKLVRPLFINRYFIPSLGVFWLTFSFLLSRSWDCKKVFVPVLVVVLVVSCMSAVTFVNSEVFAQNVYDDLNSFLKQDSLKNDVFIVDVNEGHLMNEFYTISYLLKNYNDSFYFLGEYYLNTTTNYMVLEYLNVKPFYGDTINSTDDVKNYLAANKTVWVFCLNSYETNFINHWSKKGFVVKKQGVYDFEFYKFYIYNVS